MVTTGGRVGDYEIHEEIGRGAFGVVYRARHVEGGADVALKVVRRDSPEVVGSIRREIRALARLRHPGVVGIRDHGVDGSRPWYAMNYHRGEDLRGFGRGVWDPTARDGPIPPAALATILTLLRRLCVPLAYLHGEGIVHRDLKPDNVVVSASGLPVIVDFGLALEVDRDGRELLEGVGSSGTLAFLAPEQARGELVDARTDLFALGVTAFLLLTGRLPFESAGELLAGNLPPRVGESLQALPAPVEAIVRRLLGARPADRFGHATDVAAALERAGAGDAGFVGAPPPATYLYRAGFAGRGPLLEALVDTVRAGLAAPGAVVLLGGESGIGKTRLALEVARRVAYARVATGECPPPAAPGADPGPLPALRSLLETIGAVCRADAVAASRIVGERRQVLAALIPGLGPWDPVADRLPPAEARQRLISFLAETLAAYATLEPTLVVIDDLQWADELTLDLVRLLAVMRAERLVVLGTYRSDEVGPALRRLVDEVPRNVVLARLDDASVASMVGDMLGVEAPDRALVDFLSARAEGNPFFVGEYLRSSVQARLLRLDDSGTWGLAPGAGASYEALPLSGGLRALVHGRIDALSPDGREVVRAASVLGREVAVAVLAVVAGVDEATLDSAVSELLARQVLEEPRAGRLRFLHDQLREAAYEGIVPVARRELHRAAARALEARAERAALGHHWEQAGEPRRACAAYLGEAREASARYALDDAERHYRSYLRLATHLGPERAAARLALVEGVLMVAGKTAAAAEEASVAVEESRLGADAALLARALRAMAAARSVLGEGFAAAEAYEEALAIHRRDGDGPGEAMTVRYLGILAVQQGRLPEARERFARALELFRSLGDGENEGFALGNLATVLKSQGEDGAALPMFERAIELHRAHGNQRFVAIDSQNRAGALSNLGRGDEAWAAYEESIAVLRALGDRRFEAIALANLALAQAESERRDEAPPKFERAIELFKEVGDPRSEAIATYGLADLRRVQGDLGEARARYEGALALARAVADVRLEGTILAGLESLG